MGDAPSGWGQPVEIRGDTECDPGNGIPGRKGAPAPPEERPAAHQLVGGVKDHQGDDGYPA